MPLDIFIDGKDKREEVLPLFIEEYDILMETLGKEAGFMILKSKLSDYYGESEVYLNDLSNLKEEVARLKEILQVGYSNDLVSFLDRFSDLLEEAIKKKKTIKFIGD